ncbi:hypothetical protein GMRT_12384 [Giardia muris]|uniref:GINS subunit domain-containing protein n=1 Tax=Giardia muris TaxID=5742 RepID=A0A4Z1T3Z0_GIAMU|nr:hypothetical protein GMRT_12384 [Giardia muris]|eukprot:TNJ27259.1 hypothetical protein GMRT_12384 [Giardia muris]
MVAGDYLDLSAILAEADNSVVTTRDCIEGLGALDTTRQGRVLSKHAVVYMPLWLSGMAADLRLITTDPAGDISEDAIQRMRAEPGSYHPRYRYTPNFYLTAAAQCAHIADDQFCRQYLAELRTLLLARFRLLTSHDLRLNRSIPSACICPWEAAVHAVEEHVRRRPRTLRRVRAGRFSVSINKYNRRLEALLRARP